MATHNLSMTCVANEDINLYASVKLSGGDTDGVPLIGMTDDSEDVIFGIAMTNTLEGELVTVRFPFSGILPAYAYSNVRPGDGLTIGLGNPGSFSDNTGSQYARKVAYVLQTGGVDADPSRCAIIFTRAYFI